MNLLNHRLFLERPPFGGFPAMSTKTEPDESTLSAVVAELRRAWDEALGSGYYRMARVLDQRRQEIETLRCDHPAADACAVLEEAASALDVWRALRSW